MRDFINRDFYELRDNRVRKALSDLADRCVKSRLRCLHLFYWISERSTLSDLDLGFFRDRASLSKLLQQYHRIITHMENVSLEALALRKLIDENSWDGLALLKNTSNSDGVALDCLRRIDSEKMAMTADFQSEHNADFLKKLDTLKEELRNYVPGAEYQHDKNMRLGTIM